MTISCTRLHWTLEHPNCARRSSLFTLFYFWRSLSSGRWWFVAWKLIAWYSTTRIRINIIKRFVKFRISRVVRTISYATNAFGAFVRFPVWVVVGFFSRLEVSTSVEYATCAQNAPQLCPVSGVHENPTVLRATSVHVSRRRYLCFYNMLL